MCTAERRELSGLRRNNRQLELESEILRKAAAYFARDNVLPKITRWSRSSPTKSCWWPCAADCWAGRPAGTTSGAAVRL